MASLSIIIVSWQVKNLLKKCLESIYQNQVDIALEIFVVDNASNDGTAEMVKTNFPQVKLIANQKNLGFAAANNQALKSATGQYLLLLNPDTEILNGALKKMLDFLEASPKIGIAGCKHLNADRTLQPSVRRLPTFFPIFLMLIKITKVFKNLKTIKKYLATDFDYQLTQPTEQVAGSFFLIRKKILEQVGLLDENFFLWFEEVDYCKRAKDAGWQIWYNADASIIHHGGQSFSQQLTAKKQKMFFTSAWRYFKKHGFFAK